ncbi:MAG: molybdopterin-binding protein [Fretibacterium sp.]|nr:molybdopterin-binding protein [Fretibacterium sp.]
MKQLRIEESVGHVLCHDVTRIVRGEFKGAQFRKGHIIRAEDIPMLLSMGKEHVYVWEATPGTLHENEAALRLCALCRNEHMSAGEVREGKIELTADCAGLFRVDSQRLFQVNMQDELMIATRRGGSAVEAGDKLAGMRVIPLVIEESKLAEAERLAGKAPLLELLPYKLKTVGAVITGSEVYHGRIQDAFTPVLEEKLARFGMVLAARRVSDDGLENVAAAIASVRAEGVDVVFCTGGMSVDPDDNTSGAIRASGAKVVSYGAPVLPGAMFLLGYYDDGTPVMGLPGCVMYARATVFDLLLPFVAAGVRLTKPDVASLGDGGLCLGCSPCRYPICPFAGGPGR